MHVFRDPNSRKKLKIACREKIYSLKTPSMREREAWITEITKQVNLSIGSSILGCSTEIINNRISLGASKNLLEFDMNNNSNNKKYSEVFLDHSSNSEPLTF